jgi:hypothetical protein
MTIKTAIAAAAVCSATVFALPASAMPVHNLASGTLANVEQARVVCGPYRCWWRPNYYGYGAYGFYGPRRHWGWGRHWGWRHRW